MYFIKITNMTSAIASLVSLRNRLRQALSRCFGLFDPVFSRTPGAQMVNIADFFAESIFITAKSKAESDPHAFRTFR